MPMHHAEPCWRHCKLIPSQTASVELGSHWVLPKLAWCSWCPACREKLASQGHTASINMVITNSSGKNCATLSKSAWNDASCCSLNISWLQTLPETLSVVIPFSKSPLNLNSTHPHLFISTSSCLFISPYEHLPCLGYLETTACIVNQAIQKFT